VVRAYPQGVVPIVNENDAVSANKGYTPSTVFSDNDSLASLVAKEMNAEVGTTPPRLVTDTALATTTHCSSILFFLLIAL
jgi:hypothetical protein